MPSYTLYFSDSSKTTTINVPGTDVGPGLNNYDTSLDLVGSGYQNYGIAIAQNFIKLLENFASPYPPNNAIEGQLWYDTRDPSNKVLRVNNGTVTGTRWQPASGVYKQPNDPSDEYTSVVAEGDLWVDTSNNQLKIKYGTSWTVVGPNATSGVTKTGSEAIFLESNTGTVYPVVLNWANGKVVEILSYNEFIPRTVIEGFLTIKPGANLTNRIIAKYNGTADRASSLVTNNGIIVGADEVLKNRSFSQIHTGTFIVESGNGLYTLNPIYPNRFINFYTTATGGFITYSEPNSPFRIGVAGTRSYLRFDGLHGVIGINTVTTSLSPMLDVNGGARFINTVTIGVVTATSGLNLIGNLNVSGAVTITPPTTSIVTIKSSLQINGPLIIGTSPAGNGVAIAPVTNNTYDIGSTSTPFRSLYVSNIGRTGTNVNIYGTVYGSTQRLFTLRPFKITGVITSTNVLFDGTDGVTFTTTVTRSLIEDQISTATTTATHTLLVLNTASASSSIEKISKSDFLSDVYPYILSPGMILPYGSSTPPSGFLLCDGALHNVGTYQNLFSVVGYTYGGSPPNFAVPDMKKSTTVTNSVNFINYIIKT